ncbi:hypothetical protein ACTXT7_002820 [Hymenolepis weldensis]
MANLHSLSEKLISLKSSDNAQDFFVEILPPAYHTKTTVSSLITTMPFFSFLIPFHRACACDICLHGA